MKDNEKLVYDFVKCYIDENKYSPTIREIAKGTNYNSTSYIHLLLLRLKEKGYIDYKENTCRTITILK